MGEGEWGDRGIRDVHAFGVGSVNLSVHRPGGKNEFICRQQSKTGAQRNEKGDQEHTTTGPAKAEKELGLVVCACSTSPWEV